MPTTALILVILAALAHSTWNFLAKRAAHTRHLIWFSSVAEAALFAPVATWAAMSTQPRLDPTTAVFLLATGVLHLLYAEVLLRGYRAGDFSTVYPIARGTGPLLSFFGAVLILHEHLSLPAVAGALLVTFGVLLSASGIQRENGHAGLYWGLVTGCVIAAYTLTDGYSVKVLLLSPFLVEYAGNLFRAIALSFVARGGSVPLSVEYRQCWKEALGIAILTPAGYILVLFAMRIATISHVAPIREVSMIIGVYFGIRFLGEGHRLRRLIGSALIVSGVAALAVR